MIFPLFFSLFHLLGAPAIVLGVVVAWLGWIPVSHFFKRITKRALFLLTVSTIVISFIASVLIYTYLIVAFCYLSEIPSSPIAAEKQQYFDEAVAEAFHRSIIPPVFLSNSCENKPELVCELGAEYALALWDGNITEEDYPLFSALISVLSCGFVGVYYILEIRGRKTDAMKTNENGKNPE